MFQYFNTNFLREIKVKFNGIEFMHYYMVNNFFYYKYIRTFMKQ